MSYVEMLHQGIATRVWFLYTSRYFIVVLCSLIPLLDS